MVFGRDDGGPARPRRRAAPGLPPIDPPPWRPCQRGRRGQHRKQVSDATPAGGVILRFRRPQRAQTAQPLGVSVGTVNHREQGHRPAAPDSPALDPNPSRRHPDDRSTALAMDAVYRAHRGRTAPEAGSADGRWCPAAAVAGPTMIAAGTATVAATAGVGAFAVHRRGEERQLRRPRRHDGATPRPVPPRPRVTPRLVAPKVTPGGFGERAKAETGRRRRPRARPRTSATTPARASPSQQRPTTCGRSADRAIEGPHDHPGAERHRPGRRTCSATAEVEQVVLVRADGRSAELGSAGAVIITKGTSQPLWNQRQSPSPAVERRRSTNAQARCGSAAATARSTTPRATSLSRCSSATRQLDQMKAIGDAVRALPQ